MRAFDRPRRGNRRGSRGRLEDRLDASRIPAVPAFGCFDDAHAAVLGSSPTTRILQLTPPRSTPSRPPTNGSSPTTGPAVEHAVVARPAARAAAPAGRHRRRGRRGLAAAAPVARLDRTVPAATPDVLSALIQVLRGPGRGGPDPV